MKHLLAFAVLAGGGFAAPIEPLPFRVPARIPDAAETIAPSAVHLDGWLGARIGANARNRLLTIDTEPLLAGYRTRPGSHPWIGEHIGKWLHAATLAWAYTGDPALRAKLDRVVKELIACQEPDGYLGTYVPGKRLGMYPDSGWDVWSHKYNLIGLLTYHRFTSDEPALAACRKMADLLVKTFPAERSILAAGAHGGMASTSVLEPIVLLHRITGEERYLEFARYIVKSWDEPDGPRIAATLLAEGSVLKTGNAKAYEMLSNIVGLCEFARVTGERPALDAALAAWADIVANRLYLTGTTSSQEHFAPDHFLPNRVIDGIGETCVTTTWIQLNLQLLRLTGEARFGHELERSLYNHLAAAQHPAGNDWCYFTALEGRKRYDHGITCCHSSGPRGLALAPLAAYLRARDGGGDALLVGTFEPSRATLELGGRTVGVEQRSGFPREGAASLVFHMKAPATFAVWLRAPDWAQPLVVQGSSVRNDEGWIKLPARRWRDGDRITFTFNLRVRRMTGNGTNAGRAALGWGPFVLAYDEAVNPAGPPPRAVGLAEEAAPFILRLRGDALVFEGPAIDRGASKPFVAAFVPFADAGATGGDFRVWLRAPGVSEPPPLSLLADGEESASRPGLERGSITDGDFTTFLATRQNQRAGEHWFAVTLPRPASIRRVVFCAELQAMSTIDSPTPVAARPFEWKTGAPENHGLSMARLDTMRDALAARKTRAFLLIHNDRIVYEWYAPGHTATKPHFTASLAKALVAGVSLGVTISDGRIALDAPAANYIPQWRDDPLKSRITARHLGSHTSGIGDAEENGVAHGELTGWKGAFWKRHDPPRDPFTLSRDLAPIQFPPGESRQYSNPGIAMLTYAVTAALRDAPEKDIRTLLRDRIMRPIGVADDEWSCGYGQTVAVDGLSLVASWGGGSFTARASARVGRLIRAVSFWRARLCAGLGRRRGRPSRKTRE